MFAALGVAADRATAYRQMAPWLAGLLDDPSPGLRALPFFDELSARQASHGTGGLATMPADWWTEIGPIGTLDDAADHVAALGSAGVDDVGLFPAPDVAVARTKVDQVLALAGG